MPTTTLNLQKISFTAVLTLLLTGYSLGQALTLDTAMVLPPRYNVNKKIIEMGWGMLSAAQVRDNMAILSQRPTDGIVFQSQWPIYSGTDVESIFYPYGISESLMQLDTLASINWSSNLTDNFLYFLVCRDHAAWFNDAQWTNVVANAKLISKADSAARTKGIFMDTEHYGDTIWSYSAALYPSYTLAQVKAKVRQRGKEFMQALQTHSPDIKVFCTGAWIFTYWDTEGDTTKLTSSHYCLLKDFCDGMLDGATGNAKVIDGNEIGYYWPNTINWHYPPGAYKVISDNTFIAPDLESKSDTNMEVGHGFWYTTCKPITTLNNKRRLEHHVYEELLCTDEYMWFYTEENQAFWLTPFPADADTAIRSAKNKIATGQGLGFTISSDSIATYSNDLQIITPLQNQVFNAGDTIIYSVQPSDSVNGIYYYLSYNLNSVSYSPPALYKATAVNPGIYLVYAYSDGYQKLSNPVTYYVSGVPTGIEQMEDGKNCLVYPNPCNSFVTVQFPHFMKNAEINIMNPYGQTVKQIKNISGQTVTLQRDNLSGGLYFIRLTQDNNAVMTDKLVVTD